VELGGRAIGGGHLRIALLALLLGGLGNRIAAST